VRIAGATEPGAFVTVNGISVSAPGGAFETNVTLAYGTNTVVVIARDAVGNVVEYPFTVNVMAPAGASALLLPAGLAVFGIVLGALLGFVLPRYGIRIPLLPTRARKEPEASAQASVAAEESGVQGAPPPEVATQEAAPEGPVEDERVARLRKALEDGRISKDVYEENLRKLKGSSP